MQWLPEQLTSILDKSGVEITVLVSDDQSTDGTLDFLTNISKSESRVQILPKTTRFGSAGQNFLRLLKEGVLDCDYVAYADQDDVWNLDKLSAAVSAIILQGVDGYSGNVVAYWEDGTEQLINKAQRQQSFDYMFESAGPGCSFVFSKKLAANAQKFIRENEVAFKDVALHDWFTYAFARSRGYSWYIDKEPYVRYRQHQNNVVGANSGFRAKVERWKKMQSGWYKNQILLLAQLLGYKDNFPISAITAHTMKDKFSIVFGLRKMRRRLRDCWALGLFLITGDKG